MKMEVIANKLRRMKKRKWTDENGRKRRMNVEVLERGARRWYVGRGIEGSFTPQHRLCWNLGLTIEAVFNGYNLQN